MRAHLVQCLSSLHMKPFPKSTLQLVPRPKSGYLIVEMFCVCRLPAQYGDMIACDVCDKWFHCVCVDIDITEVPKYWKCPDCL
jgi:hypothetical protein